MSIPKRPQRIDSSNASDCKPEDEVTEGATAPKPKAGAAAGGAAAALAEAPNMKGCAGAAVELGGAADGAEGWPS